MPRAAGFTIARMYSLSALRKASTGLQRQQSTAAWAQSRHLAAGQQDWTRLHPPCQLMAYVPGAPLSLTNFYASLQLFQHRAARSLATKVLVSDDASTGGASTSEPSQQTQQQLQPVIEQWYDLLRVLHDQGFFGESQSDRQAHTNIHAVHVAYGQDAAGTHCCKQLIVLAGWHANSAGHAGMHRPCPCQTQHKHPSRPVILHAGT